MAGTAGTNSDSNHLQPCFRSTDCDELRPVSDSLIVAELWLFQMLCAQSGWDGGWSVPRVQAEPAPSLVRMAITNMSLTPKVRWQMLMNASNCGEYQRGTARKGLWSRLTKRPGHRRVVCFKRQKWLRQLRQRRGLPQLSFWAREGNPSQSAGECSNCVTTVSWSPCSLVPALRIRDNSLSNYSERCSKDITITKHAPLEMPERNFSCTRIKPLTALVFVLA